MYFEGDLSQGYVSTPPSWRRRYYLTGSAWEVLDEVPLTSSFLQTPTPSAPVFGPMLPESTWDRRLAQATMESLKITGPRPATKTVKPKPSWSSRFSHWALKTYRNRSHQFVADFGRFFNRNPVNRRVARTLRREQDKYEALKNKSRIANRKFFEWKQEMAKGFKILQPDDVDEYVESCVDDSPYEEVQALRLSPVEDDSWYCPQPQPEPAPDHTSALRKLWKASWRAIRQIINSRKGVDEKPSLYIHTQDQLIRTWADQRYKLINLERNVMVEKQKNAELQSETARTMDVKVECEEKGNTIFLEQSGKSTGSTQASNSNKIERIIPDSTSIGSLSSREIVLDTFEWKGENPGAPFKTYSLPAALVKLRRQNPTSVPFQIHTFANSDFIIRVRANPNPFQVGQLQVAWLYDPLADKNIANRLNIYTLSQANHCLVNAGTGNIGEIYVKYLNPLSSLPSIKSDISDFSLDLGKLYISVLNKLTCPDTVATSCFVTVSIELVNAVFSGSKDLGVGDFAYSQASVAATVVPMLAEKLLENTLTPNNDNPPYQGSRTVMVPQSNQSFCMGNNLVEPINALRLDARGQHKSVIQGPNEMTVDYVSKIYGLVATREWSTDLGPGQLIHSYDASPLFRSNEYSSAQIGSDKAYRLPPVAVLSSLYSYWSGELRMRMDFVASKFHTGRLLVCYVPLYLKNITIDQAYSYPYQVFDLREGNQSFTFNIPYMSMLPMYPRRTGYTSISDNYTPPGRVHIFVLNPLVAMQNVSKIVEMNIYWAAGDNFNVFVPAQPSLVTSFFPDDSSPSSAVRANSGMYPWYMGLDTEVFTYDGDNISHTPAIPRYSVFPDRIATFLNLKFGFYYQFKTKQNHFAIMGKWKPNSQGELIDEKQYLYSDLFWVPLFNVRDDSTQYIGTTLGACASLSDVQAYYKDIGSQNKPDIKCFLNLLGMSRTATSGWVDNNPILNGTSVPSMCYSIIEADSQMDERQVGGPDEEVYASCRVYPLVAQLNKDLVGEKFGDLKTLCRRYQPYGLIRVSTSGTYGDALCMMPALPTGLDIDLNSKMSNYPKYVREGPLQVVLSGYRFYSGGMRLAVATSSDQYTAWVQHRADYEGPDRIELLSNKNNSANLLNAGYAQYLQSLKVNNIIQVEVPYYKNRNCLYAQRVDRTLKRTQGAASLGQVYIGVEGKKSDEKLIFTMFSSIADDFQCYAFQGFPPMFYVDDLQKDTNQTLTRMAESQMFASMIPGLTSLSTAISDTPKQLDEVLEKNLNKFIGAANDLKPDFSDLSKISNSVLADILGHIGHCIISPTKMNISWAVIHTFLKYGLIADGGQSSLLAKIINPISDFFRSVPTTPPTEPMNAGGVSEDEVVIFKRACAKIPTKSQAPTEESMLNSGLEFVSVIFSLVSAVYGIPGDAASKFAPRRFANTILHSINYGSRSFRFVLPFFKAIHEVVVGIIDWTTLYLNPNLVFVKNVNDELPMISEWQSRVEELVDARNEEKIIAEDSPWASLVEEAYVMGVQIGNMYMKFIEKETEPSVDLKQGHTMFMKLFSEITRVRNDMLKRGKSAVARREPFCVWMGGPPGVGKSQMAHRLIPDLLNEVGIKHKGNKTFVIQSGVEFWNGIRSEPCILIDDFLAVDSGPMKDQALSDYWRIKSNSTLNPNMAALPDKNLRVAPELFYINSNQMYPRPVGVDTIAFWRRRDYLVKADLTQELKARGFKMLKDHEVEIEGILQEQYKSIRNFDHLEFIIYDDTQDMQSTHSRPLTYSEMKANMIYKFEAYHRRQIQLFDMAHEAYMKQWEDEPMPHSLKDYRDEHRAAMNFLAEHGPSPHTGIVEFFKIAKSFSKGTPLTKEDRLKIVKLSHDSKLFKIEEQKKEEAARQERNKPITEEEKTVAKTADSQMLSIYVAKKYGVKAAAKLAMGAGVVTGTAELLSQWVQAKYAAMGTKEVKAVPEKTIGELTQASKDKVKESKNKPFIPGFDNMVNIRKLSPQQFAALSEYDNLCKAIQPNGTVKCMCKYGGQPRCEDTTKCPRPASHSSIPALHLFESRNIKYEQRGAAMVNEDLRKMQITLPYNNVSTFTLYDLMWYEPIDNRWKGDYIAYTIVERSFDIPADDNNPAIEHFDFEVMCECGPFRFCTNKRHWHPFRGYYVPQHFCNCKDLTPDYAWEPKTGKFVAYNLPDIYGPNCKVKGCQYPIDPKLYDGWCKRNRAAREIGCCPDMLKLGRIDSFYVWIRDLLKVKLPIFLKKIWEYITKDFWRTVYLAFLTSLGFFGSLAVISKLMSLVMPGLNVADNTETISPPPDHPYLQGAYGDTKASKDHFKQIKPNFDKIAKLQSGHVLNDNNLQIINKIKKNTYLLYSKSLYEETGYLGMRVFFIYSNTICFQRHYYQSLMHEVNAARDDWILENPTTHVSFPVDPRNWIFNMPKTNQIGYARVLEAPQHKSMLGNIASEKAHEKSFGDCYLITIDRVGCHITPVTPRREKNIRINPTEEWDGYVTDVVYAYPFSAPGYCCSILINSQLNQPIIGIHTAGNATEGYAEPISNTMFSEWLEVQIEEFETDQIASHLPVSSRMQGSFIELGKIHPTFTKRESGLSNECQSLVHGKIFPVVTAPAPLSNKDPRMPEGYSPLFSGVNNMFKPPKSFPDQPMTNFCEHMAQTFITHAQPLIEPRRRTYEEAILGIDGVRYFDSLEMNTSEGFPLSRIRPAGVSNKAWLFNIVNRGTDKCRVQINPKLMAMLQREDKLRRNRTKVFTVFEDCLKDTRLPIEKVTIEGKTRIFSISPIQFTIAFKVYFMDFIAAYMNARLKLNHAIGIRPDSEEWGSLVGKMHFSEGSQNFMSGDYKNFGPTLSKQAMTHAAGVIMTWCKHHYGNTTEEEKEDNVVRQMLLFEVIESVHLCFDNVYQVLCGAPSGSPITVILNEMVNEIYMYSAYHALSLDGRWFFQKNYSSVDNYHRHVLKCGYGDDIILNVSDEVKSFFNHKNIANYFAAHGIGYTDAEKTGSDDVAFKSHIADITFLKRGFLPHPTLPHQYLAPLNIDQSIKDVLNWRSKRLSPLQGTEQTIEACSLNAFGHGPSVHDQIRSKCRAGLVMIKSDKYLRTWKELNHIFFSSFYAPKQVQEQTFALTANLDPLLVSQNFTAPDHDLMTPEM